MAVWVRGSAASSPLPNPSPDLRSGWLELKAYWPPSGAWHAAALWPLLIMSMTHEAPARTFRQTGPWPPKTIRGDCRDLYVRPTLERGIENNESGRGHYLWWRRVRLCVHCCQRAIGWQIRSSWRAVSVFCRQKKVAPTAHTVLFWCQSVTSHARGQIPFRTAYLVCVFPDFSEF